MYYFAYGVNLNLDGMRERSPRAVFLGPAELPDHKLSFDGQSIRRVGATANIREEKGSVVWGALFSIDETVLAELDAFENYPISYQRKIVCVRDAAGIAYEAFAYYREREEPGMPAESYLSDVLEGARACKLPEAYVESLAATQTV